MIILKMYSRVWFIEQVNGNFLLNSHLQGAIIIKVNIYLPILVKVRAEFRRQ